MTCVGKFGLSAVVEKEIVINQQLHAFLPNKDILPKYLAYSIKTQTEYMQNISTAITISYLNKANCNSLPINLPPSLPEQQLIVAEIEKRLSVCDKMEESITQSLQQAEAPRQSILKKAFEGKLVPQDPNDLPAPRPGVWFVYVLECEDGSYYKGFTKDILERWKQHARGNGAEWTSKHPPKKLVHWEEFDSEKAAIEREKELKTGYGREWLKREIEAGRTRQAGEPASVLLERIRAERATLIVKNATTATQRKKP